MYQHFVPQFILRKFSDYEKLLQDNLDRKGQRNDEWADKKAKNKAKVNIIDLENGFDHMSLEKRKVSKMSGMPDMYGAEIENELRILEAAASKIIRGIESDFVSGRRSTHLSRHDKDILRRFLFIMLYRSRKFFERFDKTAEEYDSDDRVHFLDYMHKKGFTTPREVWLDNLRNFLSVRLGYDTERWKAELMETTYPNDATWFIHHMTTFFLCFCTPANPQDEFLLTQNAYGVFEGPKSHVGWTDWHNFSPINPKLLIVLRNTLIQPFNSDPLFDQVNKLFEQLVTLNCSTHPDPVMARSWLADMPVERPGTSYPIVQYVGHATRDQAQCERLTLSNDDKFVFKFFALSEKHVQIINSVFLENAATTLAITFGTGSALRRALESYLQLQKPGFKLIYRINAGSVKECAVSKEYLLGLEKTLSSLGGTVRAKYTLLEPNLEVVMPEISFKFAERYKKLGWDGLPATWFEDIDQACRITALHCYTESQIRSLENRTKAKVREARRKIIYSLNPRRVWLHLRLRGIEGRYSEDISTGKISIFTFIVGDRYSGPEDTIVDASSIFRFSSLSKLMLTAVDMSTYLNVYKEDGDEAPFWFHASRAYDQIGSILRCGSSLLESRASAIYEWIATDPMNLETISKASSTVGISMYHATELVVRKYLSEEFEEILGRVLSANVRKQLKPVLLDIVYPWYMSNR